MIRFFHYQVTYRYFSYHQLTLPVYLLTLLSCSRLWPRETRWWKTAFVVLSVVPPLLAAPALARQAAEMAREARQGSIPEEARILEVLRAGKVDS